MTEHPNATALRRAYAAMAAGDLPTVLAAFAPDAVVHIGGSGPMAGDHKGHEAITAALVHGFELTGGTQRLEVREVYADAEHGVVVVQETATRAADGRTLDVAETNLFRFGPDGLATEFWDIPADPKAHDDFFDGI
jgi:ketosteroid isomerase-like protein